MTLLVTSRETHGSISASSEHGNIQGIPTPNHWLPVREVSGQTASEMGKEKETDLHPNTLNSIYPDKFKGSLAIKYIPILITSTVSADQTE